MHRITETLWQTGTMRHDVGGPTGARVLDMRGIPDDAAGLSADTFSNVIGMLESLRADECIVTMCEAGENRSGLASVMLLVLRGMEVEDAIRLVRESVPPITTNPYVFWNPGFVAQVRAWAATRRIRADGSRR